jgi:hypothetical protein
MREIELGLLGGCGTRRSAIAASLKVPAHLLRLIILDGAGVRLLLGDADRFERIEDGVALDLELSCQIINADFAHLSLFAEAPVVLSRPALLSSTSRLAVHISLKSE